MNSTTSTTTVTRVNMSPNITVVEIVESCACIVCGRGTVNITTNVYIRNMLVYSRVEREFLM